MWFRNYKNFQLRLEENRLLIVGRNGTGKSNLLEAVELIGSLRSHRSSKDQDLVFWGQSKARAKAITEEQDELMIEFRSKGGRRVFRNDKFLPKQNDLIGPLRCVCFSALDLTLVRGEPAMRRFWLDRVVQQLEPVYSELIQRFNKLLKQRSRIWQKFRYFSPNEMGALLDAFDTQMALVSTRIHRRRKRALSRLQPLANKWQQNLSSNTEILKLDYLPGAQLSDDEDERTLMMLIEKQLLSQREVEEKTGTCKIGPHRDEINLLLNGLPARRFGSAGQQRTLVLALKMAELELIGQIFDQSPLLLLDDVLAELDPHRQLMLLDMVGQNYQCLISATHLDGFEGEWKKNSQVMELKSFK